MDEKIVNKVLEYIENIGSVVSKGAEYGFELIVKQQFIEGVVWTGFNLLSIIIFCIVLKMVLKTERKDQTEYEDDLKEVSKLFLVGFLGIVALISVIDMPENVMSIFNPEYYAIKEIIDMLQAE